MMNTDMRGCCRSKAPIRAALLAVAIATAAGPAVFAIDRQGRIVFAYSNPDFKIRLPAAELLRVARDLAAAD